MEFCCAVIYISDKNKSNNMAREVTFKILWAFFKV
jgi:hypothetical protein